MRQHDVGPHGKLDGRRADPFRRPWRAAKDGDVWGFQAAIRYADPKITAVLSPARRLRRPARDLPGCVSTPRRRANYRCHWLSEDEIKQGTFCVGGIFSNGGNEPAWFDGRVTLYQGDRPLGSGTFAHAAKPLSKYDGDMEPCRFPSQPSGPTSATRSPGLWLSTARQSVPCTTSMCRIGGWPPASAIG